MRSRDGNRSITRAICSLILLSSFASLNAKEFLISYRYVVKDATLYNETLHISDSMKKCTGKPQVALILTNYGNENLKQTIRNNEQEFIEYMHKLGLNVEHKESTKNFQNKSTTILTLKTTCFKVDFNENFARISPLK
ncbi:hypothetical protein [Sulfurimonas sp.]|uniref:hypothetical protein n=1 Tax=Sulfurimonas sp. TaxID=2022749 RepID=UPI00356AF636